MEIARNIIILATPRVGSNLLMYSLAQHPQAICGGEWYCTDERHCEPEHWSNRHRQCNLVKICNLEPIPFEGLLIGLIRNDRQAQIASWRRACETGKWIEHYEIETVEFPADAEQTIEASNARIHRVCDLIYSYEHMIEKWDQAISIILQSAGWMGISLPMATTKQS